MFLTIESFNMFFFPTLIAIVAVMLNEEKIVKYSERKRGKRNGTKHNKRAQAAQRMQKGA